MFVTAYVHSAVQQSPVVIHRDTAITLAIAIVAIVAPHLTRLCVPGTAAFFSAQPAFLIVHSGGYCLY